MTGSALGRDAASPRHGASDCCGFGTGGGSLAAPGSPGRVLTTWLAACLMMCSAGSLFVFNAYSQALGAHVHGATHSTLSYVVLVGNFGLNLGLPVGLAIDRYGARAVLAAGSLLAGAGYLWLYLGLAPAGGAAGDLIATMGAAQLYPAFLAVGLGSNVAYLPAFTVFKVTHRRCCCRALCRSPTPHGTHALWTRCTLGVTVRSHRCRRAYVGRVCASVAELPWAAPRQSHGNHCGHVRCGSRRRVAAVWYATRVCSPECHCCVTAVNSKHLKRVNSLTALACDAQRTCSPPPAPRPPHRWPTCALSSPSLPSLSPS